MKRLAACVRILAGSLALAAACATVAPAEVSFQELKTRLAPHGKWLVSERYGSVWQPSVARTGWNPYYDGHWVVTDVGQTWVSDYPWGALPYHYGTWALESRRGWVWVPGDTWAPSWVVFRTGPDVIGWAPVAPGFAVGAAIGSEPDADASFVFLPSRQFFAPRVGASALPASRTATLVDTTKIVRNSIRIENHVVVNRGPGLSELQRATGRPVRVVRLETIKGMGPDVRREMRVDEAHVRRGVRAAAPRMAAASKARAGEGGREVAPASSGSRGRDAAVEKTAYDEIDTPRPARVAHQDVYDRADDDRRSRTSTSGRESVGGETRSDRDVRLLASREKQDRGRTRPVEKTLRSKSRS